MLSSRLYRSSPGRERSPARLFWGGWLVLSASVPFQPGSRRSLSTQESENIVLKARLRLPSPTAQASPSPLRAPGKGEPQAAGRGWARGRPDSRWPPNRPPARALPPAEETRRSARLPLRSVRGAARPAPTSPAAAARPLGVGGPGG